MEGKKGLGDGIIVPTITYASETKIKDTMSSIK